MKTLVIFIILFFGRSYSVAQEVVWEKVSDFKQVVALAINARDDVFAATRDSVYRSTNGGKDWRSLNMGARLRLEMTHGMTIAPNQNLYVRNDMAEILRSMDNGDSWESLQPDSTTFWITGLVSNSVGHLFAAACQRGVLRSTNNGDTWQKVLDSVDIHGIVMGPSDEIIAAKGALGHWNSGGYRSTDNGNSWQGYGYGFTSLATHSSGTMFAGGGAEDSYQPGTHDTLYCSKDSGRTWEKVLTKLVYEVVATKDGRVFAGGPTGGIVASSEIGKTWEQANVGLSCDTVYSLAINSQGVLFAGTHSGVFRSGQTTTIPGTGDEQRLPGAWALYQNYPNPFNPSTTIQYALPSRSHVTLTVFNTLGEIVRELVNGEIDTGYHEVNLFAGHLPSGVYLYRLQAGAYTSTRKLVLVK
jgi:photosystem II stability/assembly factor-like uncharacterized protein